MRKIELSVIIITWNQKDRLRECLKSIFNQKAKCNFEVIVINNNSNDGTKEMLLEFKDKLKIIQNLQNMGVAPARNQGIKLANGRYIMMLDDDTVVHKKCFENILKFMDNHHDVWCAGTKQLRPNGSLEYNARTFYDLPTIIFRRTFLGRLFPNNCYVKKHLMLGWDHNSPKEIDWVAGGSFIMRREAIKEIGLFDEHYFFGFEDIDWCYQVKQYGKKVAYIPDAVITHYIQGSSRKLFSLKALNHLKSAFRFYYKHKMLLRMYQ